LIITPSRDRAVQLTNLEKKIGKGSKAVAMFVNKFDFPHIGEAGRENNACRRKKGNNIVRQAKKFRER